MADIAVPIASTSDSSESVICFQYTWPLKVCRRQIEDESVILNVSRPFSTSFNHVQFTWALRLTDEYVLSNNAFDSKRHVLLHLYYREGPCAEVSIEDINAQIIEPSTQQVLFSGLELRQPTELQRGSGWPIHVAKEHRDEFTNFVHERVDSNLLVVVDIKMKESIFEPLNYLPDVESAFRSQRVEQSCNDFVDDVVAGKVLIPELEHVDEKQLDKYLIHRLIFEHGVNTVASSGDEKMVRNTFAHIYFERVLSKQMCFLDDVLALLEGITYAHIPALKKEVERFICQEIIQEPMDTSFAKKMLLIAEKYNLNVLKMVVNGLLVDQIIANSNPPKELVNITHELQHLAQEIQENDKSLVGTVVTDLQELTRRVRRVSLSHSPSSHSSSPLATPTNGGASPSTQFAAATPFETQPGRFKRVSLV